MTQNPENLTTLKPLIARHQFWEERIENLKKQKADTLIAAQTLAVENYGKNSKKINKLFNQALELEKSALESKVKDAYVLAVIQRPVLRNSLSDIGDFSTFTQKERVIASALGFKTDQFFIFKDAKASPLSVDEVQASAITLSTRLLQAATRAEREDTI